MKACCSYEVYNEFDKERAERELQDYRNKKFKKSTRKLLEILHSLDLNNQSLLDIGGGIGVIDIELLQKGIKKATLVEIANAYIQVANNKLSKEAVKEKLHIIQGDFNCLHDQIEPTDLVVLDKVICCYEDYETLVNNAIRKTKTHFAFIIPRDTWWVKCFHWFFESIDKARGKKFRTYIHPVDKIKSLLREAHFELSKELYQREWWVVLYERKT